MAKINALADPSPAPTVGKRGRGRPAGHKATPETRLRLLDAAESLFAERGFFGVTTRQVAVAAEVDDAMIYYHFGNKRGLFDAVFERRAKLLHRARHDSLLRYVADSNGVLTLDGIIGAFVHPMIDLSQEGGSGWKSYFALVAQTDNAPWGREIIHKFFDSDAYELVAIIRQARPEVPDADLFWAFSFMAGSLMLALAETQRVDRLSEGLCQARRTWTRYATGSCASASAGSTQCSRPPSPRRRRTCSSLRPRDTDAPA